jgi:hypothetical protein
MASIGGQIQWIKNQEKSNNPVRLDWIFLILKLDKKFVTPFYFKG